MRSRQFTVPQGVLTVTVETTPQTLVTFGLDPDPGGDGLRETYGGCDRRGAERLVDAWGYGQDAFVHDPGSGAARARVIWDDAGNLLTLRAAGESVDVHLCTDTRWSVRTFVLQALQG